VRSLSFFSLALLATFAHADAIDEAAKREMEKMHSPSLVVGILKGGKLIDQRTYGKSSIELDVAADKDNVYEIGSCTKHFTAIATMMLVEEGKVHLDDPVSKWIPESPDAWKGITVRHLLYQTSGLPDYAFVPGIGLLDDFDRAKWMGLMTKLPLDFDPGVTWAYSNSNYALLGWIIQKASGKDYADFVTERVIKPAGLEHTLFANGLTIVPKRAQGYMYNAGDLIRSPAFSASILSDGGIVSNLEDMAKWLGVLRDHKLLSAESYKQLWAPAKLNSGRTRPYGMGFFLTAPGSPTFVGHHGASPGYGAGLATFPDKDLGVVVLFNVYPGNGEAVARAIAETYDPSLRPTIAQPTTDPDPKRTERVKEALAKYGKGEADANYLEPEVLAPMKTNRMGMASPGLRPLREIKDLQFAKAVPQGDDTMLTYRVVSGDRTYTAIILWTKAGKMGQMVLRPDPQQS
jgi:CubicO group peptidase (beta-lactamase class C family)